MSDQISLFDIIGISEIGAPEFEAGTKVYNVTLGDVEAGIIDRLWICPERENKPAQYGYFAREEGNGCWFTFWSENIGKNTFTNACDACEAAEDNKQKYVMIRKENMKPLETFGYRQKVGSDGRYMECLIAVLDGLMIYSKKFFEYPFLQKFESEVAIKKELKKLKKEIENDINGGVERSDVKCEFEDIYLVSNGKWSSSGYAKNNGAVKLKEATT